MSRWWLSFADTETEGRFLGACIVGGRDLVDATERAHRLGCNPGGEVLGVEIPDSVQLPEGCGDRLLTKEDAERLMGRLVSIQTGDES